MSLGYCGQQAFVADRRASAPRTAFQAAKLCTRVSVVQQGRRVSPVVCQATVEAAPVFKGDLLNPSYYPTSADADNLKKKWYIINADGQTLGRVACLAATYIRGKHQPTYTPSMDMGAYVVVINAEKLVVSGKKADDKFYFNHVNGRPGSYRMESFKNLQARLPERIIERAVKGMLPKGAIGRDIRLHLKAFKGAVHTHEAQKPADITSEISIKPKESAGAKRLAELRAAAKK